MKKIMVITLAAILCAAMSIPAMAFDSQFGGYWRTRAYCAKDMSGTATGSDSVVDTRTRLYYTAIFSPDFKFVNKFEFNNSWGDSNGGKIGADGMGIIRIKNSYVDFNLNQSLNFKIGQQAGLLARGFLFNDDFSGVTATYTDGALSLPFYWMEASNRNLDIYTNGPKKLYTNPYDNGSPTSWNGTSRDYFALAPVFKINDSLNVNPYVLYDKAQSTKTDNIYLGADVNAKVNDASVWGTMIMETGKTNNKDNEGYLAAVGADADLVHGQFFYASGNKTTDTKNKALTDVPNATHRSYYWSEIMGYGMFDNVTSNNSPGAEISNIMAANVGLKVKPMQKLTLTGDIWYAQLAQKTATSNDSKDLGTEVDLKASYMLLNNLQLDVVGAYLFAGKATGTKDPTEIGTQLSFSF